MTTYEYKPLSQDAPEIRLLTILPGASWDPIRVELQFALMLPKEDHEARSASPNSTRRGSTDSIAQLLPDYEALSYVVGTLVSEASYLPSGLSQGLFRDNAEFKDLCVRDSGFGCQKSFQD